MNHCLHFIYGILKYLLKTIIYIVSYWPWINIYNDLYIYISCYYLDIFKLVLNANMFILGKVYITHSIYHITHKVVITLKDMCRVWPKIKIFTYRLLRCKIYIYQLTILVKALSPKKRWKDYYSEIFVWSTLLAMRTTCLTIQTY